MKTIPSTVDVNYTWYKANLGELLKKYRDRYIVIKDEAVLDSYDSMNEALDETLKKGYEMGTFSIQLCTDDISKVTLTFHSRVRFSEVVQ